MNSSAPFQPRRFWNPRNRVLAFLGSILFLLIAVYLWVVPFLAERFTSRIPVSTEKEMGKQLFANLSPSLKINQQKTLMMQAFYDKLNYDPVYHTKVTVVESPEKNAFALPGGYIIIYSGILDSMPSWQALSALLAHETAHITRRHTLRTLMRVVGRNAMIQMITGGESLVGAVLGEANELKSLQYSRTLETEADDVGIKLMHSRNVDVEGMTTLMNYLKSESGTTQPNAFLSTHPLFDERIAHIRKQTDLYKGKGVEDTEMEGLFLLLRHKRRPEW